jgi:hypothetical protein
MSGLVKMIGPVPALPGWVDKTLTKAFPRGWLSVAPHLAAGQVSAPPHGISGIHLRRMGGDFWPSYGLSRAACPAVSGTARRFRICWLVRSQVMRHARIFEQTRGGGSVRFAKQELSR